MLRDIQTTQGQKNLLTFISSLEMQVLSNSMIYEENDWPIKSYDFGWGIRKTTLTVAGQVRELEDI